MSISGTANILDSDSQRRGDMCGVCREAITGKMYVPATYRYSKEGNSLYVTKNMTRHFRQHKYHKNCLFEKKYEIYNDTLRRYQPFSHVISSERSVKKKRVTSLQKEEFLKDPLKGFLGIAEYVLYLYEENRTDASDETSKRSAKIVEDFIENLKEEWKIDHIEDSSSKVEAWKSGILKKITTFINCEEESAFSAFLKLLVSFVLFFVFGLFVIGCIFSDTKKIRNEKKDFHNDDVILHNFLEEMINEIYKNRDGYARKSIIKAAEKGAHLSLQRKEIEEKMNCKVHCNNFFIIGSIIHFIGICFSIATIVLGILQLRSILKVKIFKYFLVASLSILATGVVLFIISQIFFRKSERKFSVNFPKNIEEMYELSKMPELEPAPPQDI